MAARSIWKGTIQLSLLSVAVKIYNAVDTSEDIKFNQLHRTCGGRVGYEKKCKKCNDKLEAGEIEKGFEYEPDKYVLIGENDMAAVKCQSTKVIEIIGFVDQAEVSPALYETPYRIGPETKAATNYALLAAAFKEAGGAAVGKIVLRDREEPVILTAEGNTITMYKLRYEKELRSTNEIPNLDGLKAVPSDQLALAKTLVESMRTSFEEIELTDKYGDALRDMIERKKNGEVFTAAATEEKKPEADTTALLMAAIEAANKKKAKSAPDAPAAEAKAKKSKKQPLAEAACMDCWKETQDPRWNIKILSAKPIS